MAVHPCPLRPKGASLQWKIKARGPATNTGVSSRFFLDALDLYGSLYLAYGNRRAGAGGNY